MPTPNQMIKLLAGTGFEQVQDPGFVGFRRIHPDGRGQLLRFFFWSNRKHADATGIPRAYIVACVGLDQDRIEDRRFRINLVEWPSQDQPRRPWADVSQDVRDHVLPMLDAPSDEGHQLLEEYAAHHAL